MLDQDEIQKWDDKLQQYVNECDTEVNEAYGPKHKDCKGDSGETMIENGVVKPKPIQVKLGELKERCVYDKMGTTDGVPKYNKAGNSVTVQQRFTASGHPVAPGGFGGAGSIVPDVIYRSADGAIAAVRDLKFPCPSGAGKEGQWRPGQEKKYFDILKKVPELVFPI